MRSIRRSLALAAAWVLLSAPLHAAIVAVNATGKAATSANAATTDAITTTGGTLLVGTCSWYATPSATITASDSKSNTWTSIAAQTATSGEIATQIFYVNSNTPTVGTGHTFSCTASGTYPVATFYAFSGSASSPLDQSTGSFDSIGPGNTSIGTGSVTPTQNGEVVIASLGVWSAATSVASITAGMSVAFSADMAGGVTVGGGSAGIIQTTAGAISPVWSWTGSEPESAAAIASFKAAPATASRSPLLGVWE